MRLLERYFYNRKIRRELRGHLHGKRDPVQERLQLVSATATWVPSVDTAHYSVRRYDAVLSRYVYAPWDWTKARDVFACNVAKASQGLNPDPFFDEHAATMKAANIPYGSYVYFDPAVNAITQAAVFCNKAEASGGYGFMVAIDCESRPTTVSYAAYLAGLGSLINEIQKRTDKEIVIYSRASFWDPIWTGAGSPSWTRAFRQWQAVYPTALQTDTAKRAILYDGFIPTFPTYAMKGLAERVGWQWTAGIPNSMIPGHNMVKAAEDGNLWLRSTIPAPIAPPLTLEEKVEALWAYHPELHP